jgi:hypothetical protein
VTKPAFTPPRYTPADDAQHSPSASRRGEEVEVVGGEQPSRFSAISIAI